MARERAAVPAPGVAAMAWRTTMRAREATMTIGAQTVLAPGQRKELALVAPGLAQFPSGATVAFGLYGVPVAIDQAGTVKKRDNFEWAFVLTMDERSEQAEVTVSSEWLTPDEAANSATVIGPRSCSVLYSPNASPMRTSATLAAPPRSESICPMN